jgi:hypothetical protein
MQKEKFDAAHPESLSAHDPRNGPFNLLDSCFNSEIRVQQVVNPNERPVFFGY